MVICHKLLTRHLLSLKPTNSLTARHNFMLSSNYDYSCSKSTFRHHKPIAAVLYTKKWTLRMEMREKAITSVWPEPVWA